MERKIIFNKYLSDSFGVKGLDSNFIRIIEGRIYFNVKVQIEYIYNTPTTICIVTFNNLEKVKKFKGITKLYIPDVYNKKIGEDNARAKAIIKVNKYFNTVLNGYSRLLYRFNNRNNIEKIIINAFERKGKKKKEVIE